VLSRLKRVRHFKKVMPRVCEDFHARLAFILRAFNVLVQGQGLLPNAQGVIPLSRAEFGL